MKSLTDRLIGIFCILATSGITCLISIASQIKDIVLFNNFKNQKEVLQRVCDKFYQFCC